MISKLNDLKLSLVDLLGSDYMDSVVEAAVALLGFDQEEALRLANDKVSFYPDSYQEKNDELIEKIGAQIIKPIKSSLEGAPTLAFKNATKKAAAPVGGVCNYRLGEDGRLYFIAKSEHYHTPLGHAFPGYRLIDNARALGITNATHNNTRGYITRLAEKELVRCVNGVSKEDTKTLENLLSSKEPKVLNRVINLETGSLACEAGIKMMLARFYRLDKTYDAPKYQGKIPVFFVMADNDDGKEANYHGTTIIAQTFRGMWPEFYNAMEQNEIYKVVSVKKNDIADFKQKIEAYNSGDYKTAGFLHEIILMNYGGIRLTEDYLQAAYALCKEYDTPTMVDEIQSCMWYKGMFLFKIYQLQPDFVIIGKGFPGGQYPASKIITTYEMDSLNQFGALVTNGQEELASIAYLVTMEFEQANEDCIEALGNYLENALHKLKDKYPHLVAKIEGRGHCAAIHFYTVEQAVEFCKILNNQCIDISAQVYKANCPPAALLKPPFIASIKLLNYLEEKMESALATMN